MNDSTVNVVHRGEPHLFFLKKDRDNLAGALRPVPLLQNDVLVLVAEEIVLEVGLVFVSQHVLVHDFLILCLDELDVESVVLHEDYLQQKLPLGIGFLRQDQDLKVLVGHEEVGESDLLLELGFVCS